MFFDHTSLFELGVFHQLGHNVEDPCHHPSIPVTLTLFDTSGIHTVRIQYCRCDDSKAAEHAARRCQLLRVRWFPATWNRPRTVFTFRLLDFLHKVQTQSKVNLYDIYNSLALVNDSAGQMPRVVCCFPSRCMSTQLLIYWWIQYRYNELSLVLKIWVHLRQLRRGGGVHLSDGFQALGPGSLSLDCPVCPHPGKNLVSSNTDR